MSLEYWSTGELEYWEKPHSAVHISITPLLRHSITPVFQVYLSPGFR
jgi:hypothetical protein